MPNTVILSRLHGPWQRRTSQLSRRQVLQGLDLPRYPTNPKPIHLIQDERGEYRISAYENVYSSCRPPVDPNAGNF